MTGLKEKEVLELRKKYGENVIAGKEKTDWFLIFISQFKNPLIYILLFVGLVSFIFKEFFDLFLVLAVVMLNVLIGFFQEYNAKKTLLSLRKILKPRALVIRERKRKEIDAKELVPNDIVVLIAGDRIPADGELIQGEILVNEAILTGEEEGILKKPEGDKKVFMGTTVLSGKGIMRVTKIGFETEIGKIGKSLTEIKEEKTPLQIKLEDLSKKLAIIISFICFIVFLVNIFIKNNILSAFKIAIVLAVAAIPEALPLVVTLILVLGMKRILKNKGLIKTLLGVETLGSTSVICIDKTGTLTEGKMMVKKVEFFDEENSILNLILNNELKSSLEIALFEYAKEKIKKDPEEIVAQVEEIYEEPFDSEKKYSMVINRIKGKEIAFIKGAPEILINFCQNDKEKILKIIRNWAGEGLRVLGLAFKKEGDLKAKNNFIFSGIVGIEDPLRPEAKKMIKKAMSAGIKIKIVTGDYKETAIMVAKKLGLEVSSENIMEAEELERISKEELKEKIDKIFLFTRITPHQKRKIVEVLKAKGEVVAMTGDGVNDSLALKEADIGIAVGEATEVAKEASDLVLLDSNFKTIILACEEGRLILSNIKKTIGYILSNSFLEIGIIFLAGILRWPPPLSLVQILYLHLICDGPPDLMFAFEPKEKGLMKKKPYDLKREPIFDKLLLALICLITIFVTFLSLFIFWHFGIKKNDLILGQTLVFVILGSVDLIYAISFKNLKKPIWKMEHFFKNKFLFLGITYGFLLLLWAIYLPSLSKVLNTTPLSGKYWVLALGAGILTTSILELAKGIFRIKNNNTV